MRYSVFFILIFLCLVFGNNLQAQGSKFETIQPFCSGEEKMTFQNTHSGNDGEIFAQEGADYNCIQLARNPEWFYFQVKQPGEMEFFISQTENADGTGEQEDVDFIVWGPFSEHIPEEIEKLTQDKIIDCSYQVFSEENVNIQNAKQGEIYIFLVLNYSDKEGFISIEQQNMGESGAGSTDCSVLDGILGGNQSICGVNSYTLDATSPDAVAYTWLKLNQNTRNFEKINGENNSELIVKNDGVYKVQVENGPGKPTIEDEVKIQFIKPPSITQPAKGYSVCFQNNPSLDLTSKTAELLSENSSLVNKEVFFYKNSQDVANKNYILNPSNFQLNQESIIYANILGLEGGCYSETIEIPIEYLEWPEQLLVASQDICITKEGQFLTPFQLSVDLGNRFAYKWENNNQVIAETPSLTITEISTDANYKVTIYDSQTGCSINYTTQLFYHTQPKAIEIALDRTDFGKNWDVSVSGVPYLGSESTFIYSLDGQPFTSESEFKNLSKGNHIIRAKEINGCGEIVAKEFTVVGYPSFFTPNGDGYNDFWTITSTVYYQISAILIFDRYGQFLIKIKPDDEGWNGIINGKQMPESEYWFRLNYINPASGKQAQFKGHFSLQR